jgi:hypothetical protein
MKKVSVFVSVLFVLLLIGLSACSSKGPVLQPTSNTSVQVTSAVATTSGDSSLSATPTVDVNALILEKLQNHHSIDRVYGAKHTREEWNATLDRMIGYGAKISEDEKKIIIDYLMSKQQ